MKKDGLIVGESLERKPGEVAALAAQVVRGEVVAHRVIRQPDGDIRYWGVDVTQYPVLERFQAYGESVFREVTGKLPGASVMMVNHIDAQMSPGGSGGGWHRDSFRPQYKAIVYLTPVKQETQGAFCYLPNSNGRIFRTASCLYRILTGGNRYSDRLMDRLLKLGVEREVILAKAGIPFFIDTSLIHRGLPIFGGHRVAAFVYMFEGGLTDEFRSFMETGVYAKSAAK